MIRALLAASRPKTLPAALVPVWVGTALAWRLEGAFSLVLATCTLASAVLIQIGTNFFNDVIDFRKGADTSGRIGPVRVTASGLLAPRVVFLMGAVALVLAALAAWPLVLARGWPILAIGLPSLYFAFGYTGGPWPLAYRGLGEVFVILFFGLVAVAGTVFVQTGGWPPQAWLLGVQVGCLSTALIAINNLRDADGDRVAGKRTLAVRFGTEWARREVAVLLWLPLVVGLAWIPLGLVGAALAPLILVPGVWMLSRRILRHPPGRWLNKALALASLILVSFAALFHIGLRW